ncbi:MAG TPA: prepilin-type N-terminal cleavage/methylation domain-containing protein [Candidatus Saccharimonadales bacterium]|nr:prepilin-type N-terminal cleavage/methylation domain-containing protein [Candidatus Saccharimonadales bacterium]
MANNKNQSGFSVIELVIVIVLLAAVGFVLVKVVHKEHSSSPGTHTSQTPQKSQAKLVAGEAGDDSAVVAGTCKDDPRAMFTHDFTEPSKLKLIEPPVIDGGNIRDRSWPAINTSVTDKVAIYAPADVKLTSGIYKIAHEGASTYDYDLWFELSCQRWFFINHITDPVPKVRKLFSSTPNVPKSGSATADRMQVSPPVSFSSGELIGYTSGTQDAHNFDLGVFDQNHTNTLPSSYPVHGDSREYHFICSFDLFPDSIKAQYYAILKTSPVEAGSLCPQ